MTIEMLGGTDHCGVQAYPEDYEKLVHRDFKFGATRSFSMDSGITIRGTKFTVRNTKTASKG